MVPISENDVCPCGSGKIFSDCCVEKQRNYELFECQAKKFFYDIEEVNGSIKELLEFMYNQIMLFHKEGRAISREKALENLQVVYKLLHEALDPFARNSSTLE